MKMSSSSSNGCYPPPQSLPGRNNQTINTLQIPIIHRIRPQIILRPSCIIQTSPQIRIGRNLIPMGKTKPMSHLMTHDIPPFRTRRILQITLIHLGHRGGNVRTLGIHLVQSRPSRPTVLLVAHLHGTPYGRTVGIGGGGELGREGEGGGFVPIVKGCFVVIVPFRREGVDDCEFESSLASVLPLGELSSSRWGLPCVPEEGGEVVGISSCACPYGGCVEEDCEYSSC
mmetsp:Transcript_20669/g.29027  ORF Transcript_20669/g.29027 Transcript_20669/m.29027 type:complete len:228 (+) Transcript_20669:163-846(+)